MLTIHDARQPEPVVWKPGTPLPAKSAWLDLRDAGEAEVQACEQVAKVKLPAREDIAGVSLPGRNRIEERAMFLQVPVFEDADDGKAEANPVSGSLRFELPEGSYGGSAPVRRDRQRAGGRRGRPANIRHQSKRR